MDKENAYRFLLTPVKQVAEELNKMNDYDREMMLNEIFDILHGKKSNLRITKKIRTRSDTNNGIVVRIPMEIIKAMKIVPGQDAEISVDSINSIRIFFYNE